MANGRDWGYKVVSKIHIYVEGGGDGKGNTIQLRRGFSDLFDNGLGKGLSKRIKVIPCGPRDDAFRNFQYGLQDHPDVFNILLVDAEVAVNNTPWQHLHHQDGWQIAGMTDEQCHLMVQIMDAWLVADMEALERYYGQGFNANPIPKNPNVEDIPKQRLETALKRATRNTTKREYHKIRHGPQILARIDPSKVRKAAKHCDRLFKILAEKLETTT